MRIKNGESERFMKVMMERLERMLQVGNNCVSRSNGVNNSSEGNVKNFSSQSSSSQPHTNIPAKIITIATPQHH